MPKLLTLHPTFHGLLRSLEAIPIKSATYDFLLVFHSNYEPIWYHFSDKKRLLQNFPTAMYLMVYRAQLRLQNFKGF